MASGFTFLKPFQIQSAKKSFDIDKSYSISSFTRFAPKLSWKQKMYTNYVLYNNGTPSLAFKYGPSS